MMPRVSVIMAVYNARPYVAEAVDSILRQSFGDFEFIIVDDGSSDGSSEVLRRFPDSRLRILAQPNQGLTASLIRGALAAKGEYLARQDADDISEARRLEAQVDYLDRNPSTGLVGTFASLVDQYGTRIGARELETSPGVDRGRLTRENQFVHGSIMMRSAAYRDAGGYRAFFRYAQDYDLVLRIAEGWEVANIGQEYYRHRMRADEVSITNNREQEAYRDIAKALHGERRRAGRDSLDAGRLVVAPQAAASPGHSEDYMDMYRVRLIYTCLRSGQLRHARNEIINRLKARPAHLKSYAHLLLTLFHRRVVAGLLRTWDRLRDTRGA